nr:pro-neuregulin-4, membrane-bound isoform isoform X1 [Equus caballus]XP_023508617.1 pro-neuregulin-4, membrane-bound isoform isoform X1 [Equus caballus]XP_023508625.1 pro-neuregulin-4, membrane-bound isoform isoform X1 [Equus caballus]XP_023508632.1 pro-neuregulin-4, membrane-bound isoform isoform X1 [Equus caballus]XP_023508636.1 pro-neuregulin-4, membrane-bound isoform isoform X1 [Equus caballus]XP_023508637.1 pro-neuregulin-4, membrane-bound isoform isoform X1 [Equus caballus]XP_02350864
MVKQILLNSKVKGSFEISDSHGGDIWFSSSCNLTDHEEPCGARHRSFCLNGGICYVIPTIPSPFCRCVENYTGARCEEIFLPSFSIRTKSDLFAAFVALAILLGTFIIGAIYFLCRNGHLQRANVVQYDINLVETNSTSAHHSFEDRRKQAASRS